MRMGNRFWRDLFRWRKSMTTKVCMVLNGGGWGFAILISFVKSWSRSQSKAKLMIEQQLAWALNEEWGRDYPVTTEAFWSLDLPPLTSASMKVLLMQFENKEISSVGFPVSPLYLICIFVLIFLVSRMWFQERKLTARGSVISGSFLRLKR